MKPIMVVCAALALSASSCGGTNKTGPCYSIEGSAGGGLQECNYLTETNNKTCAELNLMSGHCPNNGFVGCCVHSDGSAVCYSEDSTGTYQAGCTAPDSWQMLPP